MFIGLIIIQANGFWLLPKHNSSLTNLLLFIPKLKDFLVKYGYIPKDDTRAGSIRSANYLKDAIKRLQKFAGLPVTGIVDEATINLINRPRCGLPDYFSSDIRNRVKRYSLKGPKWEKLALTWR